MNVFHTSNFETSSDTSKNANAVLVKSKNNDFLFIKTFENTVLLCGAKGTDI